MANVTCHLSPVACRLSPAKKFNFYNNNKIIFKKKLDKVMELVDGGYVINGAYPV